MDTRRPDVELSSEHERLLELLLAAWNSAPDCEIPHRLRRRYENLVNWAQVHRALGAQLTFGESLDYLPRSCEMARSLLAHRQVFWQNGIPTGKWVSVVSSRLGRRLDRIPTWFDGFRSACLHIKNENAVLLMSAGTVAARFAMRAADVFQLRYLLLHEPRGEKAFAIWLNQLLRISTLDTRLSRHEAWLSPQLVRHPLLTSRADTELKSADDASLAPVRDLAAVSLSDQLFVLHLRRGGNMERLIRARLRSSPSKPSHVFVAQGADLIPKNLAQELFALGATAWDMTNDQGTALDVLLTCRSSKSHMSAPQLRNPIAPILTSLSADDWRFLTHCTRACWGPWPDESDSQYVDDLLTAANMEARTPLASLRRIVQQQRVLAIGRGIRGSVPVVCWSEVLLAELMRLRVYRAHRGRWDFEPYGICIQREWLVQRGARPVVYGDDADWQRLPAADRPFFQLRQTRGRKSIRVHDWSVEKEWRRVGSLSLDDLPSDAAMLFVPTVDEAKIMAELSRWPVLVLSATSLIES